MRKIEDDLENMSEKWYIGLNLQIRMVENHTVSRREIYIDDNWNWYTLQQN